MQLLLFKEPDRKQLFICIIHLLPSPSHVVFFILIPYLFCVGFLQHTYIIKIFRDIGGLEYATIYTLVWGIEKVNIWSLYLIFFVCTGTNCSYCVVTQSSFPVGDGLKTSQLPPCATGHSPAGQDSLSALRASVPLQLGLGNPNLALEVWSYQPFQRILLMWQRSLSQVYPRSQSPPCALVEKPFPPVPTDLTAPWVVNTRLLSQTVFLERDWIPY